VYTVWVVSGAVWVTVMVLRPRLTGICETTPDVSDPLFVPLTQAAVPLVNVAVTPLVASAPGINEASYMYSAPARSASVVLENVRFDSVLAAKALARLTLM
jgi:hypothetical protein